MKIIYQDGFRQNELQAFRQTIWCNTLHSAQAIVCQMRNMNVEFVRPANKVSYISKSTLSIKPLLQLSAGRIIEYRVEETPGFVFSADIAQAIHEMWQDHIIPKVMDCSSEFYLMESAS
jgi:guanine nucleotide-binding protein G(i) subunit alpha